MKIIGWNCRGLNNPAAVRALLDVQEQYRPDVFFISESHLNKERADVLRRKLGFEFMVVDESDGKARGLVLLWNINNKITLQ